MNGEREQFGPGLRSQREREGITLESIAETTKIKRSLLAGLERNDVSQWPHGIFRRAYVRDYAGAIGLEPEPVLAEFLRLFPEHAALDGDRSASADAMTPLRLTLAFDDDYALRKMAAQAVAAAVEGGAVLLGAAVLMLAFDISFWPTAAVLAVVYYSTTGALTGRTFQYTSVVQRFAHASRRRRTPLPLATEPEPPAAEEEDFASHTSVASGQVATR